MPRRCWASAQRKVWDIRVPPRSAVARFSWKTRSASLLRPLLCSELAHSARARSTIGVWCSASAVSTACRKSADAASRVP